MADPAENVRLGLEQSEAESRGVAMTLAGQRIEAERAHRARAVRDLTADQDEQAEPVRDLT